MPNKRHAILSTLRITRRVMFPIPTFGFRALARGLEAIVDLGRIAFRPVRRESDGPLACTVNRKELGTIARQTRVMFALYVVGSLYLLARIALMPTPGGYVGMFQGILTILMMALLSALAFRSAVANWQARTGGRDKFADFARNPRLWLPM